MRQLLLRLSPFAGVSPDNPLFRYEVRHIKRAVTPTDLRRSSWRIAAIVFSGLLAIWLVMLLSIISNDRTITTAAVYRPHDAPLWDMLLFIGGLSLCDKIVLDFYGMWAGLHSFSEDVTTKRWDVLRLTPIQADTVVNARIALAQVRAWRVLIFVVALRASVVLLALLTVFVPPLIYPEWRGNFAYLATDFVKAGLAVFAPIPPLAVLATALIFEPVWRLRMVSAGSVNVAARMRSLPIAVLHALWKLIVIWLLQICVAIASVFLMGLFSSVRNSPLADMLIALVVVGAAVGITYGLYYWRTDMWRRQAQRRIAAELVNIPTLG